MPTSDLPPIAFPPHRIGPFNVSGDPDELVLRLENRGEMTLHVFLFFGICMMAVLFLAFMAALCGAEAPNKHHLDDPRVLFGPAQNQYGLLWLVSCACLFVFILLYVKHTYDSALVYAFRRSDDAFLRDRRLVTRLRRIEYLSIHETRDPEGKYFYDLSLIYGDGRSMLLHNGYDERLIMNLANEIASFVGITVLWK